MTIKKGNLLLAGALCLALAACGTDDEDTGLTASGSCLISSTIGETTSNSCVQYSSLPSTAVESAEQTCTDLGSDFATWSSDLCSTEGEVGRCTSTAGGFTTDTIYSGNGFTAETAQDACTQSEGTYKSAG